MFSKSVKELKELCKDKNIKKYSKLKKDELIKLLNKESQNENNNDFTKLLYELKSIVKKDTKRLVCKNCNELGHNYTFDNCKENIIIKNKVTTLVFESNNDYDIKNISQKFKRPQSFITNIIKQIPKEDIIKKKEIDLHVIINENLCLCELCNTNYYHKQLNRMWNNKNICDLCWCNFEKKRQSVWDKINSFKNNVCEICGINRENTKMRFHYDHINLFDKENSICKMINDGFSFDNIVNEVNKCQYICINCHTLITEIERQYGFTQYKIQLVKNFNNGKLTQEEYNIKQKVIENIYKQKMEKVYLKLKKSKK